jgi:hypothetical protein
MSKYRQRGYQDRSGDEERPRPKTPRGSAESRDQPLRPGGRGLGKPTTTVFRCAVCGQEQSDTIAFGSICAKCSADLHTCTHCAHFDTSAAGECRKSAPKYIASKAKRNDCELYEPKAAQEFAKDSAPAKTAQQSAFDALFKT